MLPRTILRRFPRPLDASEQRADLWVNAVALAAGLVGVIVLTLLAAAQANLALTLSLAAYGAGLLAMLLCSVLYNAATTSRHRTLLRRFDHAAIFVMIAGTYTPFLAMKMAGALAGWLLVYVWVVAGLGVALKLIWIHRFERLSVLLYLFLGWTIVAVTHSVAAAVSPLAVRLLIAGGVLYSVGVLFHLWERLRYQQPIWHGCVFAAATCHYAAVLIDVALPAVRVS
jgi:hemolysin III